MEKMKAMFVPKGEEGDNAGREAPLLKAQGAPRAFEQERVI